LSSLRSLVQLWDWTVIGQKQFKK